ncbi:MAG: hypothetical protein DMF06_10665 [Verrucomicrobia bacterium]|nr:MAG: hypothetical protein DMF06_10665 [Verrucomicrobiota bacterium]
MRRILPFLIVGAVLLLTVGGGFFFFHSKSAPPLKLKTGQPGAEPAHVRGMAKKPRLTLEEFGDFQCPPCGILASTLLRIEHDYADSVRVVFREFPLPMHLHATTAAQAAEAAGLQGRFWEMHDLLFLHSKEWGKPPSATAPGDPAPGSPEEAAKVLATFVEYATSIGIDVERFKTDMNSQEVKTRIQLDQDRGASVGVDRTPVLFIDGVQVPYPSLDEQGLRALIDSALSGNTQTPAPPSPIPTPSAKMDPVQP